MFTVSKYLNNHGYYKMENKQYTKLSEVAGKTMTIKAVKGYAWKYWSNADRRMITKPEYFEGASKKYQVDTDKGLLDLGTGQIGNLLEAVFKDGQADLNGKTFKIESNGKTGMDIRYYFSEVKDFQSEPSRIKSQEVDPPEGFEDVKEEDDDLSSIPF